MLTDTMWLCRIELGKAPRCYEVHSRQAIVTNTMRKRVVERQMKPFGWIAYPRNSDIARIAAVARDWTRESALKRAVAMLPQIGHRRLAFH